MSAWEHDIGVAGKDGQVALAKNYVCQSNLITTQAKDSPTLTSGFHLLPTSNRIGISSTL